MARLFVFGIGGTGSRVIKSLIMLMASGMKPGNFDEVIPILIDPHKELKELNDCKRMIRVYSKINSKLFKTHSDIEDGFFRTKITTLKDASSNISLNDDMDFDEESSESFGDFINKITIRNKSPETLDFLSLLYSDDDFNQPLKVGFKGKPHMGSIVLNSLFDGKAYNTFKSIFGKNDQIFTISSTFGGTGAAGFPLLLKNFRQSNKPEIKNCKIGALTVSPYFKLSEALETSDIDSNDFMSKTKAALSYYSKPEFTNLYNSIYHIADPYGQTEPYDNNESDQKNYAHLTEFLGAISIFDFAQNSDENKGQVKEYCIGEDESKINFNNIGNSTRDRIKSDLTSFHLFLKTHQLIYEKQKSLPFCKTFDFNEKFFDDGFFKDNEVGLDNFMNEFYSRWIDELEKNQRSLRPFNLELNSRFEKLIVGNELSSNYFDGLFIKPIDRSDILNRVAKTVTDDDIRNLDQDSKHCKYMRMCWKATKEFVNENYKIEDNGKL